jgi:hypothetical protein
MEQCPRCGARFEARDAVVEFGQARGPLNLPAIPPRVACPGCGQAWVAQSYRYLGFISPRQLQWGIVALILAMVAVLIFF